MSFFSTNAAISVLRAGKKHPRWREAAEYVIERASPEVRLLLDVGRQLERDELASAQPKTPLMSFSLVQVYRYAGIVLLTAFISGLVGYLVSDLIALC